MVVDVLSAEAGMITLTVVSRTAASLFGRGEAIGVGKLG